MDSWGIESLYHKPSFTIRVVLVLRILHRSTGIWKDSSVNKLCWKPKSGISRTNVIGVLLEMRSGLQSRDGLAQRASQDAAGARTSSQLFLKFAFHPHVVQYSPLCPHFSTGFVGVFWQCDNSPSHKCIQFSWKLRFLYPILRDTMRSFIKCFAYLQIDHAWHFPNLPILLTGQNYFFFPPSRELALSLAITMISFILWYS